MTHARDTRHLGDRSERITSLKPAPTKEAVKTCLKNHKNRENDGGGVI
jgi:hypothetical protein